MKRKLLITLLLPLLLSGSLYAQKGTFQFGFKAAPNIGWIKPISENYEGDGITTGFSWGFVAEYNFSPNYGLSTGFTVTSNSGKLKYPYAEDTLTGTMYRKYRIKSVELPLLLKMKTKEIGYFTYYGLIGLGTSFNVSAKAADDFHVQSPASFNITREPDIKSRVNFFRESLIVGLGAQYNISATTHFFGGITFNNGFTNVLKGKNTVNKAISEKAISNYLELNVGILF